MLKKYIKLFALAAAITSCGPKPEEACECLKESANKFMLKGIRPTDDQLLLPCSDFIGAFEGDEKAKVQLTVCGQEIEEHLKEKKLFTIKGKTPEFPAVTASFDSILNEFAKDQYAAEYKYRFRKVSIDVLLSDLDSTSNKDWKVFGEPVTKDKRGALSTHVTGIYFPVSQSEANTLAAATSEVIFDKKRNRSIEFDDRWYGYGGNSFSQIIHNAASNRKSRREIAYRLEDQLRGKSRTLFGDLASGMQEIVDAGQGLAQEIQAGNYILLDKKSKNWIGDELMGEFYFNRLTVEGELKVRGKNKFGLPVFDLINSRIVKNENLLELPKTQASSVAVAATTTEDSESTLPDEDDDDKYYD